MSTKQSRKTARRKAKQQAAIRFMAKMRGLDEQQRKALEMATISFHALPEITKQRIVDLHKRID